MDLRAGIAKVISKSSEVLQEIADQITETIQTEWPVVVERASDGASPRLIAIEVGLNVAADLIANGTHRLATKEEYEAYKAEAHPAPDPATETEAKETDAKDADKVSKKGKK